MKSEEIWKEIPSCGGLYEASNLGRIRSKDHVVKQEFNGLVDHFYKGRIITQRPNSNGYMVCCISLGPKKMTRMVHRLVAEAFIPNPNFYPCVNHINEQRDDNRACNLQWCTYSMNQRAGSVPLRKSLHHSKPVKQYTKAGTFIDTYPSVKMASICTGVCMKNISRALHGGRKSAGGFLWKLAE